MAPFRKKFLAESVHSLRLSLQALGGDLICAMGDPVETVLAVCEKLNIQQVFYSRLAAFDEHQQEVELEKRLESAGRTAFSFETQTLFCPSDLDSFNPSAVMGFTKFRKIVEQSWPIRAPLKPITQIANALPIAGLSEISRWDYQQAFQQPNPSRGISMTGGESVALKRLSDYFWRGDHLCVYKTTRNGLIELDHSSKFSPSLALGCVSARRIHSEVLRYEREKISNESTLWFLYGLLWRDHFYFQALRRGRRELNILLSMQACGNLATRAGFQIVCVKMSQAIWFTILVSIGKWAYIAGAGKENTPHIFDVEQQAQAYDGDLSYRSYWSTVI